ncbi:MAG: hypothetical protein ACK5IJ_02015 [Mangrovibacterium sp.]
MTFNNREYTFCDMEVVAFGRPFGTLQGMEYKSKKNKEILKGAGGRNRSVQHGSKEYEGTLTILQSDLIALNREAKSKGYGDILDIDFDVVVSYASEEGIISVDKCVGVSITEMPKALKQGDLKMEVALPFIMLDVEHGVV